MNRTANSPSATAPNSVAEPRQNRRPVILRILIGPGIRQRNVIARNRLRWLAPHASWTDPVPVAGGS